MEFSRHTAATFPVSFKRRSLLLGAVSSALLASCGGGGDGAPQERIFPAETDAQGSLMLSAPTVDYKRGWSMVGVQAQIIKALIPTQKVVYLVNTPVDDTEHGDVKTLLDALGALNVAPATVMDRVRFLRVPHADLWVRDTGGLFMREPDGGLSVVDFDFDGYRFMPYSDPAVQELYEYDNDVSVRVAAALDLPVTRSKLVAEGGNLVISDGTAIAVESSFVQSNPDWTLVQIEQELERVLGIRKVIWLPRGLATDAHPVLQTPYMMGVAGSRYRAYNLGVNHADEMVAWIDDRTVLLPQVTETEAQAASEAGDPTAPINRTVLETCAQILSRATNAAGVPLTVVRAPEPGPIEVELTAEDVMYATLLGMDAHPAHRLVGVEDMKEGRPIRFLLAAGYMNYVVANEVVLIPKLYKPGRSESLAVKDEEFRTLIQRHYPGRNVVQVDVDALTVGGGGMHCITQQIPPTPRI